MKTITLQRFTEKLLPENVPGQSYFVTEEGKILTNVGNEYRETELPEADAYRGNTYPIKDKIKAMGFRWHGSKEWRCRDYDEKAMAEFNKEMDEAVGPERLK